MVKTWSGEALKHVTALQSHTDIKQVTFMSIGQNTCPYLCLCDGKEHSGTSFLHTFSQPFYLPLTISPVFSHPVKAAAVPSSFSPLIQTHNSTPVPHSPSSYFPHSIYSLPRSFSHNVPASFSGLLIFSALFLLLKLSYFIAPMNNLGQQSRFNKLTLSVLLGPNSVSLN